MTYGSREVLTHIDATLAEDRIGIIGANGGGKSSMIRLINGLTSPTTGTVTVDGVDVKDKPKDIRKRVGFVFADADNQIVMPTVKEDIAFSLRRFNLGKAERDCRVAAAMDRFGLAGHADHSPHLLSGGQKQMLALAAVTVIEPDVLIADEPTTLLDLRNRLNIRQVFDTLDQQLIVVTHDLDFLRGFDRVLCLDRGMIACDGSPDEVIDFYVRLMGGM
nr:ABC transporter ATP-binding protein [Corynebacterium mendelii]